MEITDHEKIISAFEDYEPYAHDLPAVTMKSSVYLDALALLKEHETKYPVCEKCGKEIDHINTSVFSYDGSDSDYSFPITYSKENGCVSFSTSQKWTGYDLTDDEQKERICCPYCGKYPFDDSIEIEFYEPVEVMMWTPESR